MLMRSRLAGAIRRALEDDGFVEIETPNLIRSTPEGARDFVVPSRLRPGEFYALPQSPQVLKQLLMVAGYDRYYQLARAFRDEDLRGDRQPEHTQVDIEMSFVSEEDVLETIERMVTRVAKEVLPERPLWQEPFPRLEYPEAMERYGSDKPDVRFGMELVDLADAVAGVDFRVFAEPIAAGGACAASWRLAAAALAPRARRSDRPGATATGRGPRPPRGRGRWRAARPGRQVPGQAAGASAGARRSGRRPDPDRRRCRLDRGAEALGHVRLEMESGSGCGRPGCWATSGSTTSPCSSGTTEGKRWDATHNPFSAPVWEEADRLESDPGSIRAQQYDLVLNGWESAAAPSGSTAATCWSGPSP